MTALYLTDNVLAHKQGRSWGPIITAAAEPSHVCWNFPGPPLQTCSIGQPTPILDEGTGRLHLLFARDNMEVFVTSSSDAGLSWSSRRNVTATTKPSPRHDDFVAPGPQRGVQLPSGRLIAGSYYQRDMWGGDRSRSYSIYSDTHGSSWSHGDDVPMGEFKSLGEGQIVLFAPGKLAMFIRSVPARKPAQARYHHAMAFSETDGLSWSAPVQLTDLYTPSCDGSLLIMNERFRTAAGTYTFLASAVTGDGAEYPEWRHNLTVFSAEGVSAASNMSTVRWKPYLTLEKHFAEYSSLLLGSNGQQVHVAYASGNESVAEGMNDPAAASALMSVVFTSFASPSDSLMGHSGVTTSAANIAVANPVRKTDE